jgi:hypothetical protein
MSTLAACYLFVEELQKEDPSEDGTICYDVITVFLCPGRLSQFHSIRQNSLKYLGYFSAMFYGLERKNVIVEVHNDHSDVNTNKVDKVICRYNSFGDIEVFVGNTKMSDSPTTAFLQLAFITEFPKTIENSHIEIQISSNVNLEYLNPIETRLEEDLDPSIAPNQILTEMELKLWDKMNASIKGSRR